MKLLLSTGIFKHVEINRLPSLLPLLREAGFRHLEIADEGKFDEEILDSLLEASEDSDIEMPNWHLIQMPPFQATEQESRKAIDGMKLSMEQGSRTGARNHVLHWDQRFIDPSYKILWRQI